MEEYITRLDYYVGIDELPTYDEGGKYMNGDNLFKMLDIHSLITVYTTLELWDVPVNHELKNPLGVVVRTKDIQEMLKKAYHSADGSEMPDGFPVLTSPTEYLRDMGLFYKSSYFFEEDYNYFELTKKTVNRSRTTKRDMINKILEVCETNQRSKTVQGKKIQNLVEAIFPYKDPAKKQLHNNRK